MKQRPKNQPINLLYLIKITKEGEQVASFTKEYFLHRI